MLLRSNIILLLIILISFPGCERDNINEPVDNGLPPSAPAEVNIFRARDGEIGIEWQSNDIEIIRLYHIYRGVNNSNPMTLHDSTKENYYFDLYLEYDSAYYYRITALDNYGRESAMSQSVSAVPGNYFAPGGPRSLVISARNWEDSLSIDLFWQPPFDADIAGYRIYRGVDENFSPDSNSLRDFTIEESYHDVDSLNLLQEYFYVIKTIDKGGYESSNNYFVSDVILDKPIQIFPADGEETGYFPEFKILTSSYPARHKIIVQSNPFFGTIEEINFDSAIEKDTISVPLNSYLYDAYRTYYWRVFTYTVSETDPNSYSDLHSFVIIPE